uniref:Zgc:162780 n=1 Tax=Pygocentrus nattereri TaxID=42514 RepID=A0AAR2IVJ2_PYGNA
MAVRLFEGKEHASSYLKYRNGSLCELGTALLAPHFTQVVGTDISPAQLEQAVKHNSAPNISYRECPAEELPFKDGSVDLVTVFSAFHWFDQPRFLQEADRILKPRACLAFLNYSMDIELSYGDCSKELNHICQEVRRFRVTFSKYISSPSTNAKGHPYDIYGVWPTLLSRATCSLIVLHRKARVVLGVLPRDSYWYNVGSLPRWGIEPQSTSWKAEVLPTTLTNQCMTEILLVWSIILSADMVELYEVKIYAVVSELCTSRWTNKLGVSNKAASKYIISKNPDTLPCLIQS